MAGGVSTPVQVAAGGAGGGGGCPQGSMEMTAACLDVCTSSKELLLEAEMVQRKWKS